MSRFTLPGLMLLTLAACAYVPDTPQETFDSGALPDAWNSVPRDVEPQPDLWHLIEDARVANLVAYALSNNPNLRQTAFRVAEAEAALRGRNGALLPAVDARGRSSRLNSEGTSTGSGRVAATVTWEADLWARLRSNSVAAEQQLLASRADLAGARNSLAANVVRTSLEIAYSEQIITVEKRRIETLTLNETLIRERYLVGIGALADLEAARTSLAQARAGLLDRQERVSRLRRALLVLLGNYEAELEVPAHFEITLPGAPVPVAVMAGRPDIGAAMARSSAAGADADAAAKALLPGLSLSLDQTRSAGSIGNALHAGGVTTLVMDMAIPLFQGGQLRAERDRARITAERQRWALRELLLTALREVEDSVVLEQSLQQQAIERELALRFARINRTLFETRYRDGLANIFDLLNAQQTAYDAEVALLNTRLRQNQNRMDLGVALGLGT